MPKSPTTPTPTPTEEITWTPAIKGFGRDMTCRGFQFAVGREYRHAGPVVACNSGFHAITGNPLAVLGYYPPGTSTYCRVELGGEAHSDDQIKTASELLRVGAEIGFGDLVAEAVEWTLARAAGVAATTGEWSPAATTGRWSPAATTGRCSPAATTGYSSPAATTGRCSPAATTGYSSPATTTGEWSPAATTGEWSPAATTGRGSFAAACGVFGTASAGIGGGFCLPVFADNGDVVGALVGIPGRDGIEPGVAYKVQDGKLVEATS